jgi:signal transduction histidine kinase
MFNSVRARIALIVIACVVPLLGIAGHGAAVSHGLRVEAERTANLELARAVGASFQNYVLDVAHTLGTMGEGLLRFELSSSRSSRLLVEGMGDFPGVRHLSWADPDGVVYASTQPGAIGQSIADRPYFQALRGGEHVAVSDLLTSSVDGKLAFVVARALRDEHHRARAVFIATVDPDEMAKLIVPLGRQQGGAIVVTDASGRLVFRHPYAPLQWDARMMAGRFDVIDRALRGEETIGTVQALVGHAELIAAHVPILPYGWVAGASRPRAEVDAPAVRQLAWSGGLALVAVAVALGVSISVGRQVTRGLSRLELHADALARGEHAPADVGGPTELRRLGSAFTEMTGRLLAARQQLERFARTADEQRKLFEMLLWEVPVGIVLVDPETLRARRANPAYLAFLDEPFRSGGVEDREVSEFFPGAEEAGILDVLRSVARDQNSFAHREYPYSGFERGKTWFYWGVEPIVSNGRTTDLLVVVNEVTELVAARAAAERAIRTRDEVLSLVSHDLRTPLAAIQSGASWLHRVVPGGRSDPELVTDMLGRIDAAARRMGRLIGDLVDLARLQEGRLAMELAPHAPAELVRDSVEMLRASAEEKGLALSWAASDDLPSVRCDRDRVGQVLTNLLTNAISATASGSVRAAAEAVDGMVRFEVSDTGPGIPSAELGGIFDRFTRGRSAVYDGTGLGLAIARALVEANGGTIGVESVVGQGTRFHFTVPIGVTPRAPQHA